jgi:hypothetical protein
MQLLLDYSSPASAVIRVTLPTNSLCVLSVSSLGTANTLLSSLGRPQHSCYPQHGSAALTVTDLVLSQSPY